MQKAVGRIALLLLIAGTARGESPTTAAKFAVLPGTDGWEFWDGQLAAYSKEDELATKNAAVIADFQQQLKSVGIFLVVVPAPDQLWVGREYFADGKKLTRKHLDAAYEFLRGKGVAVVNSPEVLETLAKAGEKTALSRETHLTAIAYEALAKAAAEIVEKNVKLEARPKDFSVEAGSDSEPTIGEKDGPVVAMKYNRVRYAKGEIVKTRRGAELMIMGDSHVTAHYKVGSSFTHHLARDLGVVPDVRWREGEGAGQSLRVDFARQKDNLEGERVVVWIFREATLVTDGEWKKVEVIKK